MPLYLKVLCLNSVGPSFLSIYEIVIFFRQKVICRIFVCLLMFCRITCEEFSCAASNFDRRCKCFCFTPVICKVKGPEVMLSLVFLLCFCSKALLGLNSFGSFL